MDCEVCVCVCALSRCTAVVRPLRRCRLGTVLIRTKHTRASSSRARTKRALDDIRTIPMCVCVYRPVGGSESTRAHCNAGNVATREHARVIIDSNTESRSSRSTQPATAAARAERICEQKFATALGAKAERMPNKCRLSLWVIGVDTRNYPALPRGCVAAHSWCCFSRLASVRPARRFISIQ